MSTRGTDRAGLAGLAGPADRGLPGRPGRATPTSGSPRTRAEPVLALTALVAAVTAARLEPGGDLWVALTMAALLVAAAAVALLLRDLARAQRRPSLTELATGLVIAAISAVVWLLAGYGPQARVGTLLLSTASALGVVLTLLIVGGAAVRYHRESGRSGSARPGALRDVLSTTVTHRVAGAVATTLAAAAAVAVVLRDTMTR